MPGAASPQEGLTGAWADPDCPSCPALLLPQESRAPHVVTQHACSLPHATCAAYGDEPGSSTTAGSVSMDDRLGGSPHCPWEFTPQHRTFPVHVTCTIGPNHRRDPHSSGEMPAGPCQLLQLVPCRRICVNQHLPCRKTLYRPRLGGLRWSDSHRAQEAQEPGG